MVNIIGCMITRNECEYVEHSIRSFINCVDRFVVVDDNSKDGTLNILERLEGEFKHMRLISCDVNRDKAQQRQLAVEGAMPRAGDVIFFPDGDEMYSVYLQTYLHRFAESPWMTAYFKFHHFWKDFIHEIKGHVWAQELQRLYKWVPDSYYSRHHTINHPAGYPLSKFSAYHGLVDRNCNIEVFHCSYVKPADNIRDKIRYYMRRDKNCDEREAAEWARKHPYFSENFNQPRYGQEGLSCCGSHEEDKDEVVRFEGKYPGIMCTLPNWKLYHDYALNMNKYMEEHWRFHNHLNKEHHQERFKYTAEFLKGKVLEVGCANGASMVFLQGFNPEIDIYGVEPTDWGFAQAKERFPGKIHKAYGENLPFEDNTFDTVLLSEMIEHVQDPGPVYAEAARVTRKRIVITTPAKKHPDPDHKRVITADDIRERFQHYNVKIHGLTAMDKPPVRRTDDEKEIHFLIAVID